MLQKIVFQDNIFQLARAIDTLAEGLTLDLSPDYFFDKTIDDILFFDSAIQKLSRQVQSNSQLSGYLIILQHLASCQQRFLRLLETLLHCNHSMKEEFVPLLQKLQGLRETHVNLAIEIGERITKSDKNNDSRDVVSRNELSELLNF